MIPVKNSTKFLEPTFVIDIEENTVTMTEKNEEVQLAQSSSMSQQLTNGTGDENHEQLTQNKSTMKRYISDNQITSLSTFEESAKCMKILAVICLLLYTGASSIIIFIWLRD